MRLILGVLVGLVPLATLAQFACEPLIQWQKSFGTPSYEYATTAQQTRDGGFVIGGASADYPIPGGNKTSPNYGYRDFWMIRTDADGNKLWEQSYGGDDQDSLASLQQTSDGGFILGGTTWYNSSGGNKTSTNYGNSDYWLVRTDASGARLWDRSFGGEWHDWLNSVQQTADGGFILAGTSSSDTNEIKTARPLGLDDFWIVRLDANGNKLWDRTYGGGNNDQAVVIRQTPDGGFVIGGSSAGTTTRPGSGELDYWIVRIDANGNRLWDSLFGGPERDQLLTMVLTADGGCVVGGWSSSMNAGNKTSPHYGAADYWVVRLDANGNRVWEQSYGGSGMDTLESISANSDGTFLLAGSSLSPPDGSKTTAPRGGWDYWLIGIAPNGSELWQAVFGGKDSEFCQGAHQTADSGYILGGTSASLDGDRHGRGFGYHDFWLVKLLPENADDCDQDGVPNAQDQCGNTPLGSIVNAQGCSIQELCPCGGFEAHDAYVDCVRDSARTFQQAGLITSAHRRQLIENARAADCPPSSGPGEGFIFGLPHRAIGHATLEFQPAWFQGLQVYPEDGRPAEPYGVSIALGEADTGLFIYPDGGQNDFGDHWFFDVKAYGQKGGARDELISSVLVTKPYYESYPVNVDLSPIHPESLTIQVLSNRTIVAEAEVSGSSAGFQVNSSARLEPRGNPYWRMPDGSVGVLIEFTSPFVFVYAPYFRIQLPNVGPGSGGGESYGGNKIFVRANRPRRHVQHISRVDAIAGGVWGFQVLGERLGVFGHAHQALGPIVFSASRDRLQINALEPLGPEEFAAVVVEAPAEASRLELDFEPLVLEENGAAIAIYLSGLIDSESLVFAEARITRAPDELTFRCDFQELFDPPASPLLQVQAFRNGRPTGTTIFSNALASGTLALSDGRVPEITGSRATINSNGVPTLGVGFAQVATFMGADGTELRGNHIRVTPLNSTDQIQSMSAIAIEMVEHQSLTITGERSTALPPALFIQPAPDQLTLSWPDNTRLYTLQSAPSLSGPFTAVTNEAELINFQNTLTLPVSRQGARFFRLAGPPD